MDLQQRIAQAEKVMNVVREFDENPSIHLVGDSYAVVIAITPEIHKGLGIPNGIRYQAQIQPANNPSVLGGLRIVHDFEFPRVAELDIGGESYSDAALIEERHIGTLQEKIEKRGVVRVPGSHESPFEGPNYLSSGTGPHVYLSKLSTIGLVNSEIRLTHEIAKEVGQSYVEELATTLRQTA